MKFELNNKKYLGKNYLTLYTQNIYILIIMTRMNEHKKSLTFYGGMEQGCVSKL